MNNGSTDSAAVAGSPPPGAESPPGAPARLSSWLMVAFLSLLYILSFLDRTVIALMVGPIRRDLGISDVQVSLLVGLAFVIFYLVMGVPMGWLVDKFPRRIIIFCGVAVWSVAQAAGGFASTFMHLFLARLLLGAGEATLNPATHSMISDTFPKRQLSTALSVYSLGAAAGIGMALMIGGGMVGYLSQLETVTLPLLGEFKSWQLVFLCSGVPGLLLALFIFAFPEPKRRTSHEGEPSVVVGDRIAFLPFLRRNWQLWLCFAASFGVMNVANGALVFWQPAYLERYFHWTPAQAGGTLGLIQLLAGASGMLFSGWLVDRLFSRGLRDAHLRYYLYVLVLTVPVVIVALTTTNVWLYIGLIWVATFVTVNSLGYSVAAVMLTTPPWLRGRASAVFTGLVLASLGQGLGPLVPALIAEHVLHDTQRLGYAIAITVGVCATIAVVALMFGMPRYRRALEDNGQ